jgi:4-oxalmesaconate hydratase
LFQLLTSEGSSAGRPGSGSAINPDSGRPFDDLKPVIESFDFLGDPDLRAIFEGNARRVFPRLAP